MDLEDFTGALLESDELLVVWASSKTMTGHPHVCRLWVLARSNFETWAPCGFGVKKHESLKM